jgi:hypothetical protein
VKDGSPVSGGLTNLYDAMVPSINMMFNDSD